jgi:hypothetical protein
VCSHRHHRRRDAAFADERPEFVRVIGQQLIAGKRQNRKQSVDHVDADFRLLAGAVNLARLAVLGLRGTCGCHKDGAPYATC